MSHARQVRGKATAAGEGPLPGRHGGGGGGGRISDDIIMAGFGWFASLLVSGTGASNWTFTTQLSDRGERERKREKSVWRRNRREECSQPHPCKEENSHTEQQLKKTNQSEETCCKRILEWQKR